MLMVATKVEVLVQALMRNGVALRFAIIRGIVA